MEGVVDYRFENSSVGYIANKIKYVVGGIYTKIGILGLHFKPDFDDVRDSSAVKVIQILLRDGYKSIFSYNPIAKEIFPSTYDFDIIYCNTNEDILESTQIVAVVTAWNEYNDIKVAHPDEKVLDLCYCLN